MLFRVHFETSLVLHMMYLLRKFPVLYYPGLIYNPDIITYVMQGILTV